MYTCLLIYLPTDKIITMTSSEQSSEKLDFKRILPIIVIVFVDLLGLSIIMRHVSMRPPL
jgi:hypothetical protein